MKKILSLILSLAISHSVTADNQYGLEFDALPWLSGGHYLSAWMGKDHWRYRAVASRINIPESFVKEGFKDYEITAYAMIVDYFPRQGLTGVWYGAGFESWQNKISNETDGTTAEFDNTVFTLGLGYVWRLTDTIYINPWAALHHVVGGTRDIRVGNQTYHQQTTVPSASVKLGWQF